MWKNENVRDKSLLKVFRLKKGNNSNNIEYRIIGIVVRII